MANEVEKIRMINEIDTSIKTLIMTLKRHADTFREIEDGGVQSDAIRGMLTTADKLRKLLG